MSDSRRSTRRTSARLADKEDTTLANGVHHVVEKVKVGRPSGASVKQGKSEVNDNGAGRPVVRGKRKPGGYIFYRSGTDAEPANVFEAAFATLV